MQTNDTKNILNENLLHYSINQFGVRCIDAVTHHPTSTTFAKKKAS